MRTYSRRSFAWLKRVGLSHVSNDWRLTFFSRAPRIRTQGLSTAAGVATNDITGSLLERSRRPSVSCHPRSSPNTLHPISVGCVGACALAGKCIGWIVHSDASLDWADSREASGNSLLNVADTSTVPMAKERCFCGIFFPSPRLHHGV